MGKELPPELAVLLDGPDPATHERAWAEFLDRYNRLLLKSANTFGGDYDARMDRYRYLVETLAADGCRRLRAYHVQARSTFPAWLTVVTRRLCVDYERARIGRGARPGTAGADSASRRRARRRLADLTGNVVDPDELPEPGRGPDEAISNKERNAALESVLAGFAPADRLLLRLRFEDDVPVRRIAAVMGFPTVFHVYRRLHLLLAEARARLEQRGVAGSEP
jgi:RNA polymerase sigma factor (sigma-70 family)